MRKFQYWIEFVESLTGEHKVAIYTTDMWYRDSKYTKYAFKRQYAMETGQEIVITNVMELEQIGGEE